MVMDVSLSLLYLIFDRLLGWLTLLGRPSSSKGIERLVPQDKAIRPRQASTL
jgi:hypothetical protein